MKEMFERLVRNKEEIESEEIKTVKMLVPMSFELKDGKCENEEDQALYEFLTQREDVIEETEEVNEANENPVVEEYSPITY